MEDLIETLLSSLYPHINDKNTPYLSTSEIKNVQILKTNCGVNADLIFTILNNDPHSTIFLNKISELNFEKDKVYKIYNFWKQGHSHVAIFYFYQNNWFFVESSEMRDQLMFHKHSEQSICNFLLHRESLSAWQEICVSPCKITKTNMIINKIEWITSQSV